MLTFEQIKELIGLVAERRLAELEIERSGFRLKISGEKAPAGASPATQAGVVAEAVSAVERSTPAASEEGKTAAEAGAESAPPGAHVLKSPIVGTFYRASSPDADPYVQIGDPVKRGQVLCIVEAMKLMNEIESDEDGVIEEIYPRNAQPVEFGEPLFAIRPA